MKKTIRFYKLVLEKDNQLNLLEDDDCTLRKKAETFKMKSYDTDYLYRYNDKVFEIISINESYIFGTFGKLEDAHDGDQVRARNRKNLDLEKIRFLIENFTYFYLDLNTNKIALLYNSKVRGFRTAFKNFIESHIGVSIIYRKIEVINLIDADMDNRFGRTSPILSINYLYANNQIPKNEFATLNEIFSTLGSEILSAKVSLKLNNAHTSPSLWNKLKTKLFDNQKDENFEDFKIETDEDTIDILENTVSKKIFITIAKDEIDNEGKIMGLLKELLQQVD